MKLTKTDFMIIENVNRVLEMVDLLLAEHSWMDFDTAMKLLICSAMITTHENTLIEKENVYNDLHKV